MFNVILSWGHILYQLIRYNVNGMEELICENYSEIYLIGDNQILELIWENQFRYSNLSDGNNQIW